MQSSSFVAHLPLVSASPLPAVITSRVVSNKDRRGDLVFLTFPSAQQAAVAVERLQLAKARAAPAVVSTCSLLRTALRLLGRGPAILLSTLLG